LIFFHVMHGSAVKAVSTLLVVKALKLSVVAWRKAAVNLQVQTQAEDKLSACDERCLSTFVAGSDGDVDGDARSVKSMEHGATCPGCKLPLLSGSEEIVVRMGDCDCVLHFACFIEAATAQHGVQFPRSLDVCEAFTTLRRLVGLEAVNVEMVRCPGCGVQNCTWAEVQVAVSSQHTSEDVVCCKPLARGFLSNVAQYEVFSGWWSKLCEIRQVVPREESLNECCDNSIKRVAGVDPCADISVTLRHRPCGTLRSIIDAVRAGEEPPQGASHMRQQVPGQNPVFSDFL